MWLQVRYLQRVLLVCIVLMRIGRENALIEQAEKGEAVEQVALALIRYFEGPWQSLVFEHFFFALLRGSQSRRS